MKLSHVSVTARDASALSEFYREVFGYVERRSPKVLSGKKVSRGNGLPNSNIYAIWLELPDDQGPFLEIMQFKETVERQPSAINETGYSHLAFEVLNLQHSIDRVLRLGGRLQGEVTNFGTQEEPNLIIYVRDPEGNVLELEQAFRSGVTDNQ
ncbi:methylmalonyl-CoA epimerase [Roseibium album]|nr:methylmalonyl-CoA epimerase [Roseibium album]